MRDHSQTGRCAAGARHSWQAALVALAACLNGCCGIDEGGCVLVSPVEGANEDQPDPIAAVPAEPPFTQDVPGTTARIEMVPVMLSDDSGTRTLWVSTTEITWEFYDVYVFELDNPSGQTGADAVTRPSRPYIPPDRGYGHEEYPTISVAFNGAQGFCRWLSHVSGRAYRLPTEAEFEFVCARGDDLEPAMDPAALEQVAWFASNTQGVTRPVAQKAPDRFGLYDIRGNVAEWVVAADGVGVAKGGSFRDGPEGLTSTARETYTRDWQQSDPQIPKSPWWLSDCDFIGFRVVCESP